MAKIVEREAAMAQEDLQMMVQVYRDEVATVMGSGII